MRQFVADARARLLEDPPSRPRSFFYYFTWIVFALLESMVVLMTVLEEAIFRGSRSHKDDSNSSQS